MTEPDRDGPVSGRVHAPDPGRLAEAEKRARQCAIEDVRGPGVLGWAHVRTLLAEYDRRGAIVRAAEALVERWEDWCPSAPPPEFAALLDALSSAVRAARPEGETQ